MVDPLVPQKAQNEVSLTWWSWQNYHDPVMNRGWDQKLGHGLIQDGSNHWLPQHNEQFLLHLYCPSTKLLEGNVFSRVFLSVYVFKDGGRSLVTITQDALDLTI